MTEKHLSSQFDSELNAVSSRVMELGGMVESQIHQAVYALAQFDAEAADRVMETEHRVNAMEIEIDRELSSIIARRQPTARDLRLLIAISKTTANLERVGDEANKIARMVKSIIESGSARALPSTELRVAADLASGLLRKALDAFARLDTGGRAVDPEGRRPDRPGVRRLRAQAGHLHDGRPAHHLGQPRPAVPGQGHRAHRRPCQEHRRIHHLHRQGRRRAAHFDAGNRVGSSK